MMLRRTKPGPPEGVQTRADSNSFRGSPAVVYSPFSNASQLGVRRFTRARGGYTISTRHCREARCLAPLLIASPYQACCERRIAAAHAISEGSKLRPIASCEFDHDHDSSYGDKPRSGYMHPTRCPRWSVPAQGGRILAPVSSPVTRHSPEEEGQGGAHVGEKVDPGT